MKTLKIIAFGVVAAAQLTGSLTAAALHEYPLIKKYTRPSDIPGKSLPAIELDKDIYKHLNDSYSNLRVFSSQNKWVPFVIDELYKYEKQITYRPLTGRITAFRVDTERNEAVIDYRISSDETALIGKLELEPRSRRQFNKRITLEFAPDKIIKDLEFFNHAGTVDFSRHTFRFAPQCSSQIRIKIAPFAEKRNSSSTLHHEGNKEQFTEKRIFSEELSLERITFFAAATDVVKTSTLIEERPIEYKKLSSPPGSSCWEFKLDTMQMSKLTVSSATPDYRRKYQLILRKKQLNAPDTEYKFSGTLKPGFEFTTTPLRADTALLTIENGDNEELQSPSFRWFFVREAIIMEPGTVPENGVTLYFGSQQDTPAVFDLEEYIGKFDGAGYVYLPAAPQENNPLYQSPKQSHWADWIKKLLPGMIALAAAVLGAVSFRTLRKTRPENPAE